MAVLWRSGRGDGIRLLRWLFVLLSSNYSYFHLSTDFIRISILKIYSLEGKYVFLCTQLIITGNEFGSKPN